MQLSDWLSQPAVNPGYSGGGLQPDAQPTGIKGPPVMNGYNGSLMQPNVGQVASGQQGFSPFGAMFGIMNGHMPANFAAWQARRLAAGLPIHGHQQVPQAPAQQSPQANPFNVQPGQPNVASGYGGYAAHQSFPTLRY